MKYLLFLAGLAATLALIARHQRKQAHESLHEDARLNRVRLLSYRGDE